MRNLLLLVVSNIAILSCFNIKLPSFKKTDPSNHCFKITQEVRSSASTDESYDENLSQELIHFLIEKISSNNKEDVATKENNSPGHNDPQYDNNLVVMNPNVMDENQALGFVKSLPLPQRSTLVAVIDGGFDYKVSWFREILSEVVPVEVLEGISHNKKYEHHGMAVSEVIYRINPAVKILAVPTLLTTVHLTDKISKVSDIPEVRVINLSIEGSEPCDEEKIAIEKAVSKGKIVIVSAGNNGKDIAIRPEYPASHNIPGMIVVGNQGLDGEMYSTSNYGKGVTYLVPGDGFVLEGGTPYTGTSMSAAVMSGVVSRLIADYPEKTNEEILNLIKKYSLKLDDKTEYGVVNLKSLLSPRELYTLVSKKGEV